jgi:hypothetical protein
LQIPPRHIANITDEKEELKVLVSRSDSADEGAALTVVTEEKVVPRLPLTGNTAEKRYMEREWTVLC